MPANSARLPDTELGALRGTSPRCDQGRVGLEIAFLDTGGWDTHVLEGGRADSSRLCCAASPTPRRASAPTSATLMADVCVLTMSEFGRTVAENGSTGTDHGRGTAMMVLGGTVRGGRVLGAWPGLAPDQLVDGRDLAVATDFRHAVLRGARAPPGQSDVAAGVLSFAWDDARRLGAIA